LGRGGGGEVREKVEEQQYTSICSSFVHGDNSSQTGSKIPTMSECIYSL
jgi:hypothetical protein